MPRLALSLTALAALVASTGCRDEPAAPYASTTWLGDERLVALEPAAALDDAGRLWTAVIAWDDERRAPHLLVAVVGTGAELELPADDPARPHLAALREGAYLVWEDRTDGERALLGTALSLENGALRAHAVERVTPQGIAGLAPRLARTGADRLELVFQSPREESYDVLFAAREGGAWSPPTPLVATPRDEWCPRSAPDGRGGLVVVWDEYDGESFDVHLAWTRAGRVEDELLVAGGPAYQGLPDVCVDPNGDAWVAWEVAPAFGAGSALRDRRAVRLGRARRGARGVEQAGLGDALGPRAGLPRVAWAGVGPVVVARIPAAPYVPRNPRNAPFFASFLARLVRFDAGGKALAFELTDAEGGNAATETLLPVSDGALLCVFASDRRSASFEPKNAYDSPLEERWRLGVATLPGSRGLPALGPAAEEPGDPPRVLRSASHDGPAALLGDLHRHTNQSRCQGRLDGLRLDVWRYARGPGALDFVAVTDHVQHLRPWSWWQTLRDTERYHDPPRLVTLFGVERNVQDEGHQNLIFRDRSAAESGVASAPAQIDPALVVAIPHMLSQRSNPFGWERLDPARHRVVEVHQGNRGSYEGPGRPLAAENSDAEGADLLSGLARGVHVGLVGSSDHASSTASYAGVLADAPTREAVFAALRARRTYAATFPARLDARLGGLRIGGEGPLPAGAALDVELGTREGGPSLLDVALVKNGERVPGLAAEDDLPVAWLLSLDPRRGTPESDLVVSSTGANGLPLLEVRPHPADAELVRIDREPDAIRIRVGAEPARVLFAQPGAAPLQLTLGASSQVVDGDFPAGEELALEELERPGLARLWNLGVGVESTVGLDVPPLAPGDTLMVRLTFAGGELAWLSPFRVTEPEER